MKATHGYWVLGLGLALVAVSAGVEHVWERMSPANPVWFTSLEKAIAASQENGRPILMSFTRGGSLDRCQHLKEEVFETPEFRGWADQRAVLLDVAFPENRTQDDGASAHNRTLIDQYNVEAYPTVVFAGADGTELGRTGYLAGGPTPWIAHANTIVLPHLLHQLPLGARHDLHEGVQALAHYTKKQTIPKQYILLLGDSYALGLGDWLLDADTDTRPPFHSAHRIHAGTGKDVITFASTDLGSLGGLVANPISQYEFVNALSRFEMAPPRFIIIYFYEGNDLNDNLRDIAYRYEDKQYNKGFRDPDLFRAAIRKRVHLGHSLVRRAKDFNGDDALFFAKVSSVMERALAGGAGDARPPYRVRQAWPPGTVNRAWVGGREVVIPDSLQGPALELGDDEIRLGVYVFEQSLAYVRTYFQTRRIGVVYIPSVLSSYRIASSWVSTQSYAGRSTRYRSDRVRARSDEIAALVERVARDNGARFMDARPRIRRRSAERFVHGPKDWKHFNKAGYSALADAAMELIEDMGRQE